MTNVAPVGTEVNKSQNTMTYLWEAIGSNIVGDPVTRPDLQYAIVQAVGTFSSQTLTLQGSIDGTNYVTLKDNGGTDITWSAAGMKQLPLGIVPPYIRPSMSSGGSPDVDLYLAMAKS